MTTELKVGDKAILDRGYKGFEQEVEIVYMTAQGLWCDVTSTKGDVKWSVMTARLTPRDGKESK